MNFQVKKEMDLNNKITININKNLKEIDKIMWSVQYLQQISVIINIFFIFYINLIIWKSIYLKLILIKR